MSQKTFWIALGVGAGVGAAVSVLCFGDCSVGVRRKLKGAYDEAGEYLGDAADYLQDRAERLSREAQVAYRKSREEIDTAYDKASGALADSLGDTREQIAKVAEEAVDRLAASASSQPLL